MQDTHQISFLSQLISDPKPGIQQPVCEQDLLAYESAYKFKLSNLLISTCKTWSLPWYTTINNFLNTHTYRCGVSFPKVNLLKMFMIWKKSI